MGTAEGLLEVPRAEIVAKTVVDEVMIVVDVMGEVDADSMLALGRIEVETEITDELGDPDTELENLMVGCEIYEETLGAEELEKLARDLEVADDPDDEGDKVEKPDVDANKVGELDARADEAEDTGGL